MPVCLVCRSGFEPFMSFGPMPIANGFLAREDFAREPFSELAVGCCPRCHLMQLAQRLDPAKLFHGNYAYYSSVSARMTEHFRRFAGTVRERYLTGEDPFVVEIGSNDGIMLQNFAAEGVRHLGVEPSANVARAATARGVRTVSRFFDETTGQDLRREYGPADAFLGANVICHLPDLPSVVRGILALLTERGVFIFEEPYLGDIIEKTSFDQIYDEHYSYFSLHSLAHLFDFHGMEVVDLAHQEVHGGSMRYVVARKGTWPVTEAVRRQWDHEDALGLANPATYAALRERIHRSKERLLSLITTLKRQGKRIAAYGATSKSTTVTNFCGIGPDAIEFICDTTPGKQGKYSPGVHIPVVPYAHFQGSPPDYALLFAWNHAAEILEKEKDFERRGGRFIVYVPEVRILE